MSNLKALIVGLGYMGKNHARILSSMENVTLAAVADPNVKAARTIGRMYKVITYESLEEALAEENVDFVTIAAPTVLHYQLAKICISRKIPTFIEKPITETVYQAKSLLAMLKKTKIPLMVGHIERFNPVVNEIKQRVNTGELGKIIKIHAQRFSPPVNRPQDVSAIIDLATHDIDVICHILNKKIHRLYAETGKILHKKVDIMSALLKFDGGAIGIIEVSWLHPSKFRNLTVMGENGMYVANYITQELFFYRQNSNLFKNSSNQTPYAVADVIKIAFEAKEPLQIELKAFVNSLEKRTTVPVSCKEGLSALEIALKLELSGQKNKIYK